MHFPSKFDPHAGNFSLFVTNFILFCDEISKKVSRGAQSRPISRPPCKCNSGGEMINWRQIATSQYETRQGLNFVGRRPLFQELKGGGADHGVVARGHGSRHPTPLQHLRIRRVSHPKNNQRVRSSPIKKRTKLILG